MPLWLIVLLFLVFVLFLFIICLLLFFSLSLVLLLCLSLTLSPSEGPESQLVNAVGEATKGTVPNRARVYGCTVDTKHQLTVTNLSG